MKQESSTVIVRDIQTEYGVAVVPAGNLGTEMAAELADLHEYALFCAQVYKAGPGHENEPQPSPVAGWTWLESPEPLPTPRWRYRFSGFGCQVWCKQPAGAAAVALIVFRGTDRKQLGDWFANFRWITRFIPLTEDQYEQTQRLVPEVVKRIRAKFGEETTIVAAGHSLGGGLAQQAAYAADHIKLVYAFDPSTVTGYYDIPREARRLRCLNLRIYRVYEYGEILEYLRLLMKAVYPVRSKNPKIVEVRYNLLAGKPIGQHSMQDFADKLRDIAGKQA